MPEQLKQAQSPAKRAGLLSEAAKQAGISVDEAAILASHIQVLRGLIVQSPTLLEQLRQSKSAADSTKVLAEAPQREGLDIDEADLNAYYAQVARQAQSSDLSDVQLDTVAGALSIG